jgi:adenosylcobinamide-phosphate synthase
MVFAIALLFALLLDRAFGEPGARWHPVVWMGRYLAWMGRLIAPRERLPSPNWSAFSAGALAWYGGAMALGVLAYLLQTYVLLLPEALAGLVLGALLKPMLAWRMLRSEIAGVEWALGQSLEAGRSRLGRLVSRDVMQLDESQVRESAIESLAENLNDSVIAPLFWFALFGLPGAVVYRFANTADAMWGYRGFRGGQDWEWAGKWAARADDVLSWVPARISALLIALMAGGLPLAHVSREAAQTPSPNSGWPMAAMALAVGVRLRKPGVYALNGEGRAPKTDDTVRSIVIASRAVLLALALAAGGCWLWSLAW